MNKTIQPPEHLTPSVWEALALSYRVKRQERMTGEALAIADKLTELVIEGKVK